jgi:hypothetical protein
MATGKPAIGTGEDRVPTGTCSFQAVLPKTCDWRTIREPQDIDAAIAAA